MELPPPGNRRVSINNPQETSGRVPTTPAVFPTQSSRLSSISSKRSANSYAYRPSIMSNRSSGAPSLLPSPSPGPHKGSLSTPGPLQSKASNISSVRYADEEGKPLQEKDKDQDKGKGKGKGAGTRLLTMLKKTLQGSQSDEVVVENQTQTLIPFGDVVGCLAIHIKSCRQFSQRFIVERHFNLFMRVSINHIVKCTKLRHLKTVNNEKNLVLRFDEVKYFSVQVPRRQDDERNYIYLELMEDGGDSEKPPFPLGSAESHLYEVIQKGCFTEIMQLMRKNSAICRVEVEFMFSYGNFGYGFSHQLKPLQKLIEPSMFMSIAPPPERTDPVTNVITPQRVEYPAFLSPEFNVNIGVPETSQATTVQLEKLREKPRERLEKMKEEYRNMNTWMEKADYLRNLINPKMVKRDTKGNNEPLGSNSSILEELERTTYDIHHRKSEALSNELMDYGDKEGRVIPVLKLLDQNFSESSLSRSDELVPQEDVLLPPIHTLQIIEEDEMPPLQRPSEPEERPREERKSIVFSSDEELMPKHPSILKIASSQQESKRKIEKSPHFSDVIIIPDKPLEELNTNKKGRPSIELRKSWERRPTDIVCSLRKVAFAQKEYTIPVCKSETTEFKPKHQFQKLSKSGLDPFLRNINSKMSFRKKKDHDNGYRHLSTLSTELLEHEDQDPPYPEHLGSAGSDTALPENPRPFTVQMANKNSLPPDPITATIMISDRKNKLSLDSAFNSANNSNTKSIFASDNPVVSLTKLSDSDNKLLTDSSFNTTKSSNRRLSRDSNSNTTKPSDTKLSSDPSSSTKPSDRRLSSDPSSGTTKPSDTKLFSDPSNNKLSRDPSSNATQLSGSNRLSYNPSINGNKSSYTSDLNRVSHDPSIISTKSSDPNKLSRDPSIILAKSSDPSKLSRDPSIISTKSSDPNKLSRDPSINSTRLSDPSKLSRDLSIISTRSSDPSKLSCDLSIISTISSDPTKLSCDPSIISTKSSDPNKLSHDSSIISAKFSDPNKLSSDPSVISTKSSDPNKLSRDPSINSTRLSDPSKLSCDPSIISAKSSDPNKLSRDPSINSTKLSDPSKLSHDPSIISHDPSIISHDPSIISAKSDPSKLSRDPSINSTRLSDPSKLSRDPSIISTKSSDPNKLSRDSSIISAKSSDANKLSRDPSIISAKSSDPNKLSRDPSVISAKSSDPTKLSRDPSIISAKSSDPNKLSRDPSIISAKSSDPNKLSRAPSVISAKSSDANKLSHDPSIISTKSSDPNKLSRDPSIISRDPSVISTKSSDPNKLSRDPSINSTRLSDPTKLSRDPSIISAKSSDPNKLSRDPSIISRDPNVISAKSSDPNKLSRDPSIISTKLSDPSNLSHDSNVNARKCSDMNKLSQDPSIISTKSLDSNNRLPSGNPTVSSDTTTNTAKPPVTKNVLYPDISTVDSSDKQNKLEWLPNVSLSNVQGASSVTENVNIHHPSSSINFTSDIEILKQSIVLKSILSKNLQDLSDELFSKPEVYTNDEGYSLPPSVHSKPSDSTDNRVFEKVQDLNSWRSSKDLLNSQVLLSPVVKRSPQDLLPEGEPGKSSDIEEYVSEKLLEAAERNFPMNRKSSFKKKHLVSEDSGSEHVLSGSIYEYVIKQIFTAPIFSQLGIGTKSSSEAQMDSQHQLLTPWERSASSQIFNYDEKGNEVHLSQSKSVISQIIQSFPVNTLLESGIIKVIELDKEHQSSLLDSQTTSSTEQYSDIKSQIRLLSRQNTSSINYLDSSVSGAEYTEDCQSISTQESKYPISNGKSDSLNEHQSLDTEETELSSNLESSSSSLVKDSDTAMLKSVLKNIFSIFFKYNHQSERRQQPEKESESLIKHSSSSGTEHLEKNQENFNKADKKVDRKPILNPKLRMFLEKLSETEVKNLKSELSKHIQHYLVERLTESGHITKEDLPTIYHKLYLMNEKAELKEQSPFQEKYSETVREIMSFVNNFNHHFIDKHLETKLRGFLSEILQNYFLKNLSVSNLFNETDAMALHASMSPVRSNSELGQDIADGNFGSSLKINMKCPVSKSLQNYLQDLSENELLSLKTDLSKYLQVLFIEKLYKSGLVSEGQLKGISQEIISLQSPPIPLKHIKTNLPFRNESYFMREDLEEQKKYSKNGQNTALQTLSKDKCEETELSRKEERESSFSLNLKESLPTIWEQKTIYTREEETLNFIEMQSFLNKNNQANPLTRSPERPSDISLRKQKKDHGFMQFTQVDSSVYKTEIQDPYSWDGRSKTVQSKSCFEKTSKMKQLDKRESNNFYKLNAQEKLDTEFSPYLKLPNCKVSKENESQSRLSFPTWQTNTFIHVKPEIGEQSKLDHYYQRLRGNNNNNKKHLVTFAQFKNEMETLYRNPYEEACSEKRAKISESQTFKYKENEKNSRPFFFPEVLKRENIKSKRKERDHATKPKKSFHKIVRLLPATLPTTRPHLRKSVPRNLLHWTARRTIHDCLDRFDDLHTPSVKCPKKSKSRTRLLGKSPDDSHNQAKHGARPYTAPEPNKRRESAAWKFASPRMVSAGLVHFYATPEYEIRKVRSRRKLKEDIEKRPLISEIIQMLDTAE